MALTTHWHSAEPHGPLELVTLEGRQHKELLLGHGECNNIVVLAQVELQDARVIALTQ